jgi:MFS family permease
MLTLRVEAGISPDKSFQLNLINSCLGFVANALAWPLTAWFDRRTIYLWGTAANVMFLFLLGTVASVSQNAATNYVQAVLGIIISFAFAGTLGPISYTIISETSSVRLRALSTGVGRAAYYVAEIPMIFLASQMLNGTGWNMAGKCGYVWGPLLSFVGFRPSFGFLSSSTVLTVRATSCSTARLLLGSSSRPSLMLRIMSNYLAFDMEAGHTLSA